MNSKQFYNFPIVNGGLNMVNINNIANISLHPSGCSVTLNVKDKDDKFINFVSTLPFGNVTGIIMHMDNSQNE